MVNFDPTVGHEQAGPRPAVVVTVNEFNSGPRGLVFVIPITGTDRSLPTHIAVNPPEGGLSKASLIMIEQSRSVSKSRLIRRMGAVEAATMDQVGQIIMMLLGL